MKNISQKSTENQNTHFKSSKLFYRKSCRLWDNVENYDKVRKAKHNR